MVRRRVVGRVKLVNRGGEVGKGAMLSGWGEGIFVQKEL